MYIYSLFIFYSGQSFEENEELYKRALNATQLNRIRGTYLDVGSYKATIKEDDDIDELEIIFKDLRANIKIESINLSGRKKKMLKPFIKINKIHSCFHCR